MTKHKAEKRAVRARMAKTGERYTTARHYLLDLHRTDSINGASTPDTAVDLVPSDGTCATPPASGWVEPPGMSEEAIKRNTGKSWDDWFAILDAWEGTGHTHAEIAKYLNETYEPGGWWAQSITVGYERARGMRKKHQQVDGFSIGVSKTVAVPVARVFQAFTDEAERDQWLERDTLRPRTSQPDRSARFDVGTSGTLLAVSFVAKGESKTSVQVQESRLPTADEVDPRRVYWRARLNQLAAFLTNAT